MWGGGGVVVKVKAPCSFRRWYHGVEAVEEATAKPR